MIRYLLAAVLAASCTPAPAQSGPESMQAKFGGLTVTIYDAPCVDPVVLDLIMPAYKDSFKRASIADRDRTVSACWIFAQGVVLIVDADGQARESPPQAYGVTGGV